MTGVSEARDGWTGEPCPKCSGTGEADEDPVFGRRICKGCGGTGEEYDASQDDRDNDGCS